MKWKAVSVLFFCLYQIASWNSYGNKGETVMFPAALVSCPDAVNRSRQASLKNNKTEVDLFLYLWMWLRSLKRVVQRGILCVMKKPLPSLPPKVCLQEGFRCCFAYGNIRRTRPRSIDLNGGMRTSEANEALLQASIQGHADTVRELLQQGAEVNMADSNGTTALHWASMYGCTDIVRELLQHGAELNRQGKRNGYTALHYASASASTDTVKELLQHGAEMNTQTNSGATALHRASERGRMDIVRELLQHGAEVNTQAQWGYTALHQATMNGHLDTVRELLQHGAEVNTQDNDGSTPLYWASMDGHADIVRELLEHGAEVNTQGKDGHTALLLAINNNYPSIVELLLTHGAVAEASLLSFAKKRALSKVASLVAKQLGKETEAAFLEKGCFYPVFVCTVEAFLSMPNIMKHEEALKMGGCIVMIPVNAVVVFFSHRWLNGSRSKEEGGAHPDRDDAYKCRAMQQAIQNDFPDATHVWVDFLCVPQEDPDSQLLAINSLPYIVRQCAHFVVLHGMSGKLNKKDEDEASFIVYNSRGWCRLECLSALAPSEEGEQETRKWRLDMNAQTVEQQPHVFAEDLSIFNPFGDGSAFCDDRDREKIALMVYNLAKRFEQDFGIAKSAVKFFPDDLKEKFEKLGSI